MRAHFAVQQGVVSGDAAAAGWRAVNRIGAPHAEYVLFCNGVWTIGDAEEERRDEAMNSVAENIIGEVIWSGHTW